MALGGYEVLRNDLLYKFMEIAISLKYLEEHVNILPRMDEADNNSS